MGTPKVSLSLSLAGARKEPPSANGVKRPRSVFQDEDDEDEQRGRVETVSHFDRAAGGAIDESKRTGKNLPLVIPRQANRDWKEAANQRKRQKGGLGPGQNDDQDMRDVIAKVEASKPQYGLNVSSRDRRAGDVVLTNGEAPAAPMEGIETSQKRAASSGDAEPSNAPTEDQEALDALLGKTTAKTTLVVPQPIMTESDAFRHDFTQAPDMASLAEYTDMPVEQFGAAMLRGMGWKDGEGIGSQRGVKIAKAADKLPERRANLLGIGAKEDAALAGEMGAWGKAARGRKGEVKIYNPVLLRDKKTGAMFTEEELKKKQEREEREKYEREFEQKEKERERRRRREEEDDARERRRHKERDNDRDHDRRREKDGEQRRRDKESDEEYYRRKEKERRRRERERDDKDSSGRDRERSRKHRDYDEDEDRRRDRHRSDRDGDRRRR